MSLDPGADFLRDPGAEFLASDPGVRFLADNLPMEPASEPAAERDPLWPELALGIAAGFLAWRFLVSRRLRAQGPPEALEIVDTSELASAALLPSLRSALAAQVAQDYAASLGGYIHSTSAQALVSGYVSELSRGAAPSLAWDRAAAGFGLDATGMRSWLMSQRSGNGYDDASVRPSAQRILDRALMRRATTLGRNEGWSARQTGRSVLWMTMAAEGSLMGARKRWVTAQDEMVCEFCAPLHNAEVDVSERFEVPGGDVWAPGVHPNCRCELVLVRVPQEAQPIAKLIAPKVILPPTDHEVSQLATASMDGSPTPAGVRRRVGTKVVDLAVERRRRRLVAKALGDDPFDRDRGGRFSARELRSPEPVRELVPAGARRLAEVETEPEAEVEAEVNPFTSTEVNPFTSADVQVSPFSSPQAAALEQVSPFAQVDPFAQVSPFATPQAGGGGVLIVVPGLPEPVDDNQLLLASTDVFFKPFEYGYGNYGYREALRADPNAEPVLGTAGGPTAREGKDYPLDLDVDFDEEISTNDIGKEINFDAWSARIARRSGRQDMPLGFPASLVNTGEQLLAEIHGPVDMTADWSSMDADFDASRSGAAQEALSHIQSDVRNMTDTEVQQVFLSAGETQMVRDLGADGMRNYLLTMKVEDYFDDAPLVDAYVEFQLSKDPDMDSEERAHRAVFADETVARVPQYFSFKTTSSSRMAGGEHETHLFEGKWRITGVRIASLTMEDMRARKAGNQPMQRHPAINRYRIVDLEKVEGQTDGPG